MPIASLRLKQIRDGLEDLEYMYLLDDLTGSREAGERSKVFPAVVCSAMLMPSCHHNDHAALAIVNSVMRTTYDFDFEDPTAMLGARAKLAEAIEQAVLR